MFNLLIDVHWCPLYVQSSLSATNRFTSLFQSGNEKVETVIFHAGQKSHLSLQSWKANLVLSRQRDDYLSPGEGVSTFGQAAERNVCKTWNHTNSSKPAHCFVTCRRTKQRTSLRVYNLSALHAASVSWKAASGMVNSTLLPLVLSASCCAKAAVRRQLRSK